MNKPPMRPENILSVRKIDAFCPQCEVPAFICMSKLYPIAEKSRGVLVGMRYARFAIIYCERCGAEFESHVIPEPLQN